MRDSLRVLAFAAALGAVCAALLAGANHFLRPLQEANEQALKWRTVLQVLGVPHGAEASASAVLALAKEKVRQRQVGPLVVYEYAAAGPGGPRRAFQFSGPGLWGPVEGLLCLAADLKTIYAVSFYKHEETPGLGGEIGSADFCERFVDKRTFGADGAAGIRVVRAGGQGGANEVDGITGATMTSEKVQAMINAVIGRIEAHRAEILRGGSEDADGA